MSRRHTLKAALIASTCLMPLSTAWAEDDFSLDDTPTDPAAVEKPVLVNEAGIAVGVQSGGNAAFGRYSGMTKDGMLGQGWAHLQQRATKPGEGNFYVLFDAKNVDFANGALLPDASVDLRTGQQGKWDLRLGYQGVPFVESDNFHTLFDSSGALQNGLSAGSISTSSATGVAQARNYLTTATVGTRRDRVKGDFKYTGLADWTFRSTLEHEHKQGTKTNSFMFVNNNYFASFLEPINYDTDRFTVSAAYTKPKLQAQTSYTYSTFTNNQLQWVAQNPFSGTTRAGYSGSQYSLPPSNSEHMLKASMGMNMGETGRLALNTRYSLQLQNDTLAARYYDAGTSGVDASSYDGVIHNIYANLAYSVRPVKEWTLRAAYTLDDRDNHSASYLISPSYRGDTGTATWNGSGGVRYNTPYSFLNQKAELESGYRLSRSTRLVGTYTYLDKQRDYSVSDRNQESRVGGKLQTSFAPDLSGQLSYAHAIRQAQDYNGNLGWNYMGRTTTAENELAQYNYAARRQDEVKGTLTWALSQDVSVDNTASWTNNFYPNSTYGVTEDHIIAIGPNLGWNVAPGINTHLYYQYQEIFTAVTIQASTAANGLIWKLKNEDSVHTVGGGAEWQVNDRFKLSIDNALSYGKTSFALAGRTRDGSTSSTTIPTNLPDALSFLNSLRVSGEYEISDGLSLGLTGMLETLVSHDYLNWQEALSTSNTSSQTVVLGATGDPGYTAGVLLATVRMRW